ncbi:phage tail tape measure protein [Alkalibacillus almallahensis]|uniref:phage tail tape measure protein n=1 Tax=Alkalibacillus almallahensis TaxID=1379154 RepID=UPI00141D7B27|nr:phage tail tape measure protein [Alkalibacillus almallahensis]NIK12877.1 phage-related minor tail protein [Alkalibacillus almallahensis]
MADGRITIDTEIDQKGAEKGTQALQKKLDGTAQKAKTVGGNMTKYLTAPILAFGAVGMNSAKEFSGAQRTIQNELGLSQDEAEKLTDVANDIYKKGFGESLDQTAGALADVKKQLGDLATDENIEKLTTDSLALSEIMDAEVNEISRTGATLMKEFGDSGKEAMDLIAWGSQNGLDFSDELLDNIAEYGPLFSDMGYSSEEYFNLLKKGADEGSYNLDYLNDVMKEFDVKLSDGTAAEAIGTMSQSTQDMFKKWKDGEATTSDVMDAVTDEMSTMDKRAAEAIGPEIFGTKFEDLGVDAVLAMGNVDDEIKNLDGTMGDITKTQEESFGQRFRSLLRKSGDALRPLGNILLDLAENALPPLINAVTEVAKWFDNLSPVTQKIVVVIGALLAAIGPLLVILGMVAGAITAITAPFLLWTVLIGVVIAFVVTLAITITKNWDKIKERTVIVWNVIKSFFSSLWDGIKNKFTTTINAIKTAVSTAWNWIKSITASVWNGIKSFFSSFWAGVKGVFKWYIDTLKNNVSTVWNWIKKTTQSVWNGIKNFFSSFWGGIKNIFMTVIQYLRDRISNAWQWIKGITSSVWNGIKSTLSGIWNGIKDTVSSVFNGVKDTVLDVWNTIKSTTDDVWDGIVESIKGAINGVIGAINGMLNSISDISISLPNVPDWVPGDMGGGSISFPNLPNIPKLDVGTNFVAQDGLAMLHQGEAVVPKEYNPAADGENEKKQPVQINLTLGSTSFKQFVEDITEVQDREERTLEAFRG